MPRLASQRICNALLAVVFLNAIPSAVFAQNPLTLERDGLGGITASTRFDIPTLRSIITNVVWTHAQRQTEDGTQDVIIATRQGKTGFTLFGDGRGRVAAIEIVSRRIDNELGPRVGDGFQPLNQRGQLGTCWTGMEARSGHVLCSAAQTKRVVYAFTGRWNGPDGQMPPAFVLDNWTVSHIIWRPDRFAQIDSPQTQEPHIAPAFDCNKARGSVEEMICRSAELARLDRSLNAAYAKRLAATASTAQPRLRTEQRGWIKGRNDCWKSSDPHQCVVDIYNDRIADLSMKSASLVGTSWIGTRIAGDVIPRTINIDMAFGTDGKITGTLGCNRFFASYSIDGHDLRLGQIGSTRRMCPEIQMLAERRFLDALERVDGWAMRNEDLILFGTGAELTFHHM